MSHLPHQAPHPLLMCGMFKSIFSLSLAHAGLCCEAHTPSWVCASWLIFLGSLLMCTLIDPEGLQSGFGLNFVFWSGEFWENCPSISRRILAANFQLVSRGPQAPLSQEIHPRNSRPELLALFSNFRCLKPTFFHADFCLRWRSTLTRDLIRSICAILSLIQKNMGPKAMPTMIHSPQ